MSILLDINAKLSAARQCAVSFESTLGSDKRKRLGQFFTGLPLSRILAALSVRKSCTSIIDPMAGHGDLLDAVLERCLINGIQLLKIDAIEVDSLAAKICRKRLQSWRDKQKSINLAVYESSAFNPELVSTLPRDGYDLVITNPPYVRYQRITGNDHTDNGQSIEGIRESLLQIVTDRIPRREQNIWRELVMGYSGLSDLSVPAWLLAALLVKPGGVLALVAPATWRNRDYADVLQYLLTRCFQLEKVIADRQPGWFSEALVRTNLVIATRLHSETLLDPIFSREHTDHRVLWVEVDRIAKGSDSLIGAAFTDEDPEGSFAKWLLQKGDNLVLEPKGIIINKRREDSISKISAIRRSSLWLRRIESFAEHTHLFDSKTGLSRQQWLPHELQNILPNNFEANLHELSKMEIKISQGLRTGCNGFFYVEMVEQLDEKAARIRVSDLLGGDEIIVPIDTLKPVIRRQSELDNFKNGLVTPGYVLDLRGYVLPENLQQVKDIHYLYILYRVDPPVLMPKALAALVRRAAQTLYNTTKGNRYIPELSAVRTNVRQSRSGPRSKPPRFWYMLPDFMRRHLPDAFVPRVNQDTPYVIANRRPPLLIDANFLTLWVNDKLWTSKGLTGVMNSAWSRACLEAIGTPMGGGALKLEATHLHRILIPKLLNSEIEQITEITRKYKSHPSKGKLNEIDHIIVNAILNRCHNVAHIGQIIDKLQHLAVRLKQERQRG